ncbi:HNH endonuclease [Microbacterium sp. JZ70]
MDNSKGIRNPSELDATLSILTTYKTLIRARSGFHYRDQIDSQGRVTYSLQKKDAGDNVKLFRAYQARVPLVYFHPVREGLYDAHYPVFLDQFDWNERVVQFWLPGVQDDEFHGIDPLSEMPQYRNYKQRKIWQRAHQAGFRLRVLNAYRHRCAVCALSETVLLEAAHIYPDLHERGEPVVTNGLSLCKIHHAAFDGLLMAITPSYRVEVAARVRNKPGDLILGEILGKSHGREIARPVKRTDWPDPLALEYRFERFLSKANDGLS